MALKLRLDVQAVNDLTAIRAYLLTEAGPATAERILSHLQKRIGTLRYNPRPGVKTTEPDIRILPAARYPYRVYYTITSEAVVILHVRHSARSDPDFGNLSS
ncbi:MAG: type II toxin-antitoxin system RelE/ParE family toxin [Rhodomicrobium sp.]|nr:type II toxin-antitoxin system RelE/ParE family toxin [Rhodomicrobium sp.]